MQSCDVSYSLLSLLDLGDESLSEAPGVSPVISLLGGAIKVHSNPYSLHSGFLENPKYRNNLECNSNKAEKSLTSVMFTNELFEMLNITQYLKGKIKYLFVHKIWIFMNFLMSHCQ